MSTGYEDHENKCIHKFVTRRRLNEAINAYVFEYKHCDLCGHNEFVSGNHEQYLKQVGNQ